MKFLRGRIKTTRGDTHSKRGRFEDFVESIFPEKYFDIVRKTMNTGDCNGRGSEDCRPDYQFRDKKTKEVFNVECRHVRNTLDDESIQWCEYNQVKRYKAYRNEEGIRIFIMIGVGGKPRYPTSLFCLDLDNIKSNKLFRSSYERYEICEIPFESLEQLLNQIE